jgi:hypothetical protein
MEYRQHDFHIVNIYIYIYPVIMKTNSLPKQIEKNMDIYDFYLQNILGLIQGMHIYACICVSFITGPGRKKIIITITDSKN